MRRSGRDRQERSFFYKENHEKDVVRQRHQALRGEKKRMKKKKKTQHKDLVESPQRFVDRKRGKEATSHSPGFEERKRVKTTKKKKVEETPPRFGDRKRGKTASGCSPRFEERKRVQTRTGRSVKERVFFSDQDYSKASIEQRHFEQRFGKVDVSLSIDIVDETLIKRLTEETRQDRMKYVVKKKKRDNILLEHFPKNGRCMLEWKVEWTPRVNRFGPILLSNDDDDDDDLMSIMNDLVLGVEKVCDSCWLGTEFPRMNDFYATIVQDSSKAESEHLYFIENEMDFDVSDLVVTTHSISGKVGWTIPDWIQPGKYHVEFGSSDAGICCTSNHFIITENFGEMDYTCVGVWCVCGAVHECGSDKFWVMCNRCHSWHHWDCYGYSEEELVHLSASSQMEKRVVGHLNDVPFAENEFTCWLCKDFKDVFHPPLSFGPSAVKSLERRRTTRMLNMITRAAGGYKRKLRDRAGEQLAEKRLYCTPDHVVCFLKTLLGDNCFQCADLGAGIGALSAALPVDSVCIEIEKKRCARGQTRAPHCKWVHDNALEKRVYRRYRGSFDRIITNPDFEVALQFLCVALYMLKPSDDARLFVILPSDFFEASPLRARCFKLLPLSIEVEYKLGHISYLQETPHAQKLTVDSLFVLKRGRGDKFEHRVVNARLAGML